MKSPLIFLLLNCLVLAGIPVPSQSGTLPPTPSVQEKASLTALNYPNLLRQKAGEYVQTVQKLDPSAKDFFKKLEAQNPWLLDQKAGDGSALPPPWPPTDQNTAGQKAQPKGGGISTGGAILIALGAVTLLCVAGLVAISNGIAMGGGGSC